MALLKDQVNVTIAELLYNSSLTSVTFFRLWTTERADALSAPGPPTNKLCFSSLQALNPRNKYLILCDAFDCSHPSHESKAYPSASFLVTRLN